MRILTSLLLTLTVAALAGAGCTSSTSIEQTWRAPTAPPGSLVNVVTLYPGPDGVVKRSAEDRLAMRLNERGMRAVPAYSVLNPDDVQDQSHMAEKLRAQGFDGIVAMRLLGTEQQFDYYPTFDMYWGDAWGTVVPVTITRVEIDAYSLKTNQLVWSAMSRSIDAEDIGSLIDDVTKVASKEIYNQDIISSRR